MRIPKGATWAIAAKGPVAAAEVVMQGLVMLDDGTVVEQRQTLLTPAADTIVLGSKPATAGELLGVTLSGGDNVDNPGDLFAALTLKVSEPVVGNIYTTLIAGWIPTAGFLAWPAVPAVSSLGLDSPPRVRTPANPSLGEEASLDLTGFGYRRLIAVAVRLVTSAEAGTRRVRLRLVSGSTVLWFSDIGDGFGNSSTFDLCWFNGAEIDSISQATLSAPLPNGGCPAGTTIETDTTGLEADDQFSAFAVTGEEFLSDL